MFAPTPARTALIAKTISVNLVDKSNFKKEHTVLTQIQVLAKSHQTGALIRFLSHEY